MGMHSFRIVKQGRGMDMLASYSRRYVALLLTLPDLGHWGQVLHVLGGQTNISCKVCALPFRRRRVQRGPRTQRSRGGPLPEGTKRTAANSCKHMFPTMNIQGLRFWGIPLLLVISVSRRLPQAASRS